MVYSLIKAVLTPIFRCLWRVRVHGLENVPTSGPVILAANHQAFCDSLFIALVVGRRVTFVAKAEYFQSPKTSWLFRALGQIPMHREGGDASSHSLGEAICLLRSGGCLAIYPEGTRPPDERLHRGRTGVARLALATRCPVVPIGVRGTRAVQPVGSRVLRPFHPVELRIGAPLDFAARYGDRSGEPLVMRQVTDELMWEIRQLSGQEYVDRYASRSEPPASGESVEPAAVIRVGS